VCKEYFNVLGIKFVYLVRELILFYRVLFVSILFRFYRFWYFNLLNRNTRIYSWYKIIYAYDILDFLLNIFYFKVYISFDLEEVIDIF
jgi:hypothetical protein